MAIDVEERRWRETIKGMKLEDRKWTEEELFAVRKQVLAQWETGRELEEIETGIEYNKNQPWYKSTLQRYRKAKEEGDCLWTFVIGHATFESTLEHIQHCEYLEPDHWCVFGDPYTRKSQFELAKIGIERSYKEGKSMLSGYPIVNYGVEHARKIVEATKAFFLMGVHDEDPRLQWEIALAAGFTSYTTFPISCPMQHSRYFPLEKKIQIDQYSNRLAAYYTEHGAPITAYSVANITGYDEMGMKAAIVVLQALMAARQGVKSIAFDIGLSSHLISDVATIQVGTNLTREYLDRFGYTDVELYGYSFAYLGAWPVDKDEAQSLVTWTAITAMAAGCQGVVIKTPDEASVTPTKYGSEAALKACKRIREVVRAQKLPEALESPRLVLEREMMEKEIRAIVDKTLEMGDGDIAAGMVRALDAGVIDIAFSCWTLVKGNVLIVRDDEGAIRYLEHGNIPLPKEVVEYHQQRIAARGKGDIDMVIDDVAYCSRPFDKEVSWLR